jgi:hypothetical protein
LLRLPEEVVKGRGLGRRETSIPSYSVELTLLAPGGGELYPVLSANARQQLRRAFRSFERRGSLCLPEAAILEEALKFFAELKALHSTSWERRGKAHAFSGAFFEPFHRRLIESSFDDRGNPTPQSIGRRAGNRLSYNYRRGSRIYAYQSGSPRPVGASGPAWWLMPSPTAERSDQGLASMISWPDAIGSKRALRHGVSRCFGRFSSPVWLFVSNASLGE